MEIALNNRHKLSSSASRTPEHCSSYFENVSFPEKMRGMLHFAAFGSQSSGVQQSGGSAPQSFPGPNHPQGGSFDPFFYISDAGEIFAKDNRSLWANLTLPAFMGGGILGMAGVYIANNAFFSTAGGHVSWLVHGAAILFGIMSGSWLLKKPLQQLREEIHNHFHGPVQIGHESIADLGAVFQSLRIFTIRYAREVGLEREVVDLLLRDPSTRLLTREETSTLSEWLRNMGQGGVPLRTPSAEEFDRALKNILYEDSENGRTLKVVSASLNPFRRRDVERNMIVVLKRILESLPIIHRALLVDPMNIPRNQIMSHVSNTLGYLSHRFTQRGYPAQHILGNLKINNDIMWKNHRTLHILESIYANFPQ